MIVMTKRGEDERPVPNRYRLGEEIGYELPILREIDALVVKILQHYADANRQGPTVEPRDP
jgi:hypothetical protein